MEGRQRKYRFVVVPMGTSSKGVSGDWGSRIDDTAWWDQ